ncbi:hypothetical protein, partial [Serratia bockelmannii]|uniref:hypothetical protein n=1 Tax=Serratia bockelmannii TaxID=2703793 RepID=UPI003FA739A9
MKKARSDAGFVFAAFPDVAALDLQTLPRPALRRPIDCVDQCNVIDRRERSLFPQKFPNPALPVVWSAFQHPPRAARR